MHKIISFIHWKNSSEHQFLYSRVDMHSMIYNTRSGHVLMGGMQNKLVELDLNKVKEIRVSGSFELLLLLLQTFVISRLVRQRLLFHLKDPCEKPNSCSLNLGQTKSLRWSN